MSSRKRLKRTSCTAERRLRAGLGGGLLLLTASALAVEPIYPEQVSAELRPLVERLHAEGKRNMVLNLMEVGTAAFQEGDYRTAEDAFDSALIEIETVYAANESATKARSLWYSEGAKDFKGEPYERVMAYYYRGLLDLRKGDFDNAQAAFETGLQQDAFAEEEQNSADFALMSYLKGWSFQQLGDLTKADEYYKEVQRLRPSTVLPKDKHNTLIIVETGKSPRKLSDGVGHYELLYRRGKRLKQEYAKIDGNAPNLTESIYFQASSRGGRPVDSIIEGKVSFKSQAASTGEVLSDVGSTAMHVSALGGSSGMQNAGLAIGAVGLFSTMAAVNARTEADTRYWSNLPDRVHVYTTYIDYGKQPDNTVEITVSDKQGKPLPELTQRVPVKIVKANSGFGWVKTYSALQTEKGER